MARPWVVAVTDAWGEALPAPLLQSRRTRMRMRRKTRRGGEEEEEEEEEEASLSPHDVSRTWPLTSAVAAPCRYICLHRSRRVPPPDRHTRNRLDSITPISREGARAPCRPRSAAPQTQRGPTLSPRLGMMRNGTSLRRPALTLRGAVWMLAGLAQARLLGRAAAAAAAPADQWVCAWPRGSHTSRCRTRRLSGGCAGCDRGSGG